ncbi:MAG: ShET2/EspL2 family type secretion system effector toxin [Solimicrobium sp.]|jgi:hypothetical protein|nr:ShET2/EspL2 family type secretion system effector toxin [Solimicrobium sp.]
MQIGIEPMQVTSTLREKVKVKLDSMSTRWNYPPQEWDAMSQCFLKMWNTEEAENCPDILAKKQLSLLKDLDNYPDLRIACFDLTTVNSSGGEESVFPLFLELQEKVREIMTNTSTMSTSFVQPQHHNRNIKFDSYLAGENQLSSELSWQGRTYNKNNHAPEELIHQYKSQPYISITGIPLLNLNEEVCFLPEKLGATSSKKIVCRHFAAQFVKDTWRHKSGKVNLAPYSSKKSIAQHIPIEIEIAYNTLINNAKRYELIGNDKLGKYLCACFQDMRSPEKQETIRALFLESTQHVMAFSLRIKGSEEHLTYVILFYDANKTNVTVRCETKDLSTLKNYSLKHFINGLPSKLPGFYEEYYGGVEPTSLLMECNLASFTENITQKTKMLENFPPNILTSTDIFFLLSGNFAIDLAGLRGQLQTIAKSSPERLFELLAAKAVDGTPGLNMALQEGCANAIKSYEQLIHLVPENEYDMRADLLAAKRADGAPGLFLAMQNGHAAAVKVYGELVQRALMHDRSRQVKLLAANGPDGTPALFMALQHGHADAIKEYGKLLPKSDLRELITLVAAKRTNIAPGLFVALEQGHVGAVEAYGELLQLLPNAEYKVWAKLLAAKESHGIPGLFMVLYDGNANTLRAYGKLLQLLPKNEPSKLIDLIAARDGDVPGILLTIHNGHFSVVEKAYTELFQLLNDNELTQLFNLLESTNANSISQLCKEQNSRKGKLVEAHKKLLHLISDWRTKFFNKK